MQLSIVIPTWNEAENLARAVQSAWRGGADEVIVVDGGSDDGTPAVAASLRCTLLTAPRGRAGQQNAGAAAARGDVLLFLHADNWLAADDIKQQLAAALADSRCLHGAFRQRIDAPGMSYRLLEWGNAARVRWLRLPYGDQAIFLRRDAFEQAGGFPSVPILEDLILMQRLRRIARPALLPGPLGVSARRWQRRGILRQTLRNWWLVARHALGASPDSLAQHY